MSLFTKPKKPPLALDMAPLIDVVFQLLIFFMLTSSFVNPAIPLKLPAATAEAPAEPPPLVVSVDQAGLLYINAEQVQLEQFQERLATLLAQQEQKTVNFQGDRAMPYERFVDLMDRARKAGAGQFNIVHQHQE